MEKKHIDFVPQKKINNGTFQKVLARDFLEQYKKHLSPHWETLVMTVKLWPLSI